MIKTNNSDNRMKGVDSLQETIVAKSRPTIYTNTTSKSKVALRYQALEHKVENIVPLNYTVKQD
jgi:hypothetical protein